MLTDTLKRVHSDWDQWQLPHKENSWLVRCAKLPDLNTNKTRTRKLVRNKDDFTHGGHFSQPINSK